MHITFLGTRGGITSRSPNHFKHSVLSIEYYRTKILIDYGLDWIHDKLVNNYNALFITHAHADHSGGLANQIITPVYTTQNIAACINQVPQEYVFIKPYKQVSIDELAITAFPVYHSFHTPTVGYRVSSRVKTIFYAPDLAGIETQHEALKNIDLYIGDGAIISRQILMRKKNNTIWGHAPITRQLDWCAQENIKRAIFTHCGSEIVKHAEECTQKKVEQLEKEYNISIQIAYDGFTLQI